MNNKNILKSPKHIFLQTLVGWYTKISVAASTGGTLPAFTEIKDAFQKFHDYFERDNGAYLTELEKLEKNFDAMCLEAQTPNNFTHFSEEFSTFFSSLINLISLSEVSLLSGDGGDLEAIEGLRFDYVQEMERLNRDGLQFCICLLQPYDQKDESLYNLISGELRGFDRAYQLDDRQLVVSLKQTDKNGSSRFLKRAQSNYEKNHNSKFNAVIAQPVAGEPLESVLMNLQKDMKRFASDVQGDIVILQELSPLERHLKENIK